MLEGILAMLAAVAAVGPAPQPLTVDAASARVVQLAEREHGTRDRRVALAAQRYVRRVVTPERWAQLPDDRKPTTAEEALRTRAGLCGNQVEVFLALMDELGVPARAVSFYYESRSGQRESHVVAEARWDGAWHLLDVTYATRYVRGGRILGLDELERLSTRQQRRARRVQPGVSYPERIYDYLRPSRDRSVLPGQSGTVRLPRTDAGYELANLPTWIGRSLGYAQRPRTTAMLLRESPPRVRLTVSGAACPDGELVASSGWRARVPASTPASYDVPAGGRALRLRIESPEEVCYVLLSRVEAPSARPAAARG